MSISPLKYYDTEAFKPVPIKSKTMHSEFLRNGRIKRFEDRWLPSGKRYYSPTEVAEITGKRLTAAGERANAKLNNVHPGIRFPDMVYHRIIDSMPHLGYCHVTASRARIDRKSDVLWSFYFTNFTADIGGEDRFFENIDRNFSRMYFAVAINAAEKASPSINRTVRNNGVLFKTSDPNEALYNVLMLGAKTKELRDFIKSL
jgi:hypothetical protein